MLRRRCEYARTAALPSRTTEMARRRVVGSPAEEMGRGWEMQMNPNRSRRRSKGGESQLAKRARVARAARDPVGAASGLATARADMTLYAAWVGGLTHHSREKVECHPFRCIFASFPLPGAIDDVEDLAKHHVQDAKGDQEHPFQLHAREAQQPRS